MSHFDFNVYPNITVSSKIIKAEVHIIKLVLFKSVNLAVVLYDETNRAVKSHNLILDESNGYSQWTEDKWLIDWIKTQLNMI